jgi:hypothetical protein
VIFIKSIVTHSTSRAEAKGVLELIAEYELLISVDPPTIVTVFATICAATVEVVPLPMVSDAAGKYRIPENVELAPP